MKPNKTAWLAAAFALVAAGSWLMMREATTGRTSDGQKDRSADAPRIVDRKIPTALTSIRKDPASAKPAASVDASTPLHQATDRSANPDVPAGTSAKTPMASQPSDAGHSSIKPSRTAHNGGPAAAPGTGDNPSAVPPAGLRLAADVRLPAAALPVDFKMTPVAEKALANIIDDYYRDLATGLAPQLEAATHGQESGGDGALIETGGNGEKTVVVTNGKVAEEARKRADARFKAIFGNAAFNRMTMRSNLESRLPADGRN